MWHQCDIRIFKWNFIKGNNFLRYGCRQCDSFWVPNRQNKKRDHFSYWHYALVEMAKPVFSKLKRKLKKFPLVPQRDPYLKKPTLGYQRKNFEKKNYWENLARPFWPVCNANRKNGLTFYSTPWEPRNLPRPPYSWTRWSGPFLTNVLTDFLTNFLTEF